MKRIHINLPVKNLNKSKEFYAQLGFKINSTYTDEHQKCMVWSEHIYVILLSHDQFLRYGNKPIPSSKNSSASYFTLSVKSLERVNEKMERGLKAGGTEPISMIDEGFMQLRRIEDFDGHIWDIMYFNEANFRK